MIKTNFVKKICNNYYVCSIFWKASFNIKKQRSDFHSAVWIAFMFSSRIIVFSFSRLIE